MWVFLKEPPVIGLEKKCTFAAIVCSVLNNDDDDDKKR